MAWRSSGTNNEEMVDNLKRFQVISKEEIEKAFRNVDRKFFVPATLEESAHLDQPLKEGHVHISAPHIYGSALEALELVPDSCSSFLNIGSGTGYLSCIVADILGPRSVNFGIEIHKEVVDHSRNSIENWLSSKRDEDPNREHDFPHLQIVHGNALHIDGTKGECLVGFDRIYIGAAVDRADLAKITKLLSPGGILVGPVEDELVKIIRIGPIPTEGGCSRKRVHEDSSNATVEPSQDAETLTESYEFSHQVLSGVRFAPLLGLPAMSTVLPARKWTPALQKFYPESFQQATMHLFMCSNSEYVQPLPPPKVTTDRLNLAATLPRVLWLEILSYTHRKWFEPERNETEYLKKRVMEEQAKAAAAQQARMEAESRCQLLERERDLYRLLARRWQSRIQVMLQQQRQNAGDGTGASQADGDDSGLDRVAAVGLISGEDRAAILFGSMLQQALEGGSTEDDGDNDGFFLAQPESSMEEEEGEDEQVEHELLRDREDSQMRVGGQSLRTGMRLIEQPASADREVQTDQGESEMEDDVDENQSVDMDDGPADGMSTKSSRLIGMQPRTVSLGDDDDL